jgi:hypothetical protein
MALMSRRPAGEAKKKVEQQHTGAIEVARSELQKRRKKRRAAESAESRTENAKRKKKDRVKRNPGDRSGGNSSRGGLIGEFHPEGGLHKFPLAILGADGNVADNLFSALASAFSPLQFERASHPPDADLVISFGAAADETRSTSRHIVVMVDPSGSPRENASIARLARRRGAILLRLDPILRRFGAQRESDGPPSLTDRGCEIVADAIRQRVVGTRASIALASGLATTPEDMALALALTDSPLELLRALDWPTKGAPKSWHMPLDPRAVQAFLSGKINGPAGQQQKSLTVPFDWKAELPEAHANTSLHSLDFVSGLLVYWLQKANRTSSAALSQIDKVVKKRNATASALLGSAGDILFDFLQNETVLPDSAWRAPIVQRRACVFALYLLCCRTAAVRRIRFDETPCGPVFRGLLEALERIRSCAEWPLGTSAGVANAAILVSLALPLRKLPYGAVLLDQSLKALQNCQLAAGMSADGFWREGMAQHGDVLATLRLLSDDLRQADVESSALKAEMLTLATFARGLLREDGTLPPVNEWPPGPQTGILRSTRAVLRSAAKGKDALKPDSADEATLFADAGFFISRRQQAEERQESELAVQIRAPSLGGMSLSFSCSKMPLLVGGGAATGRVSPQVRRSTRMTPAAHNAVRINRQDYPRASNDPAASSFEHVWNDDDWAATTLVNNVFAGAQIRRTAIHLKAHTALLVVDEIIAQSASSVEQFWHFAPELQPEKTDVPDCLCSPHGALSIAWTPGTAVALRKGGEHGIGWTNRSAREVVPNWYAVQKAEGEHILTGACFRWNANQARPALRLEAHPQGWDARASGEGFAAQFQMRDGRLIASGNR